MRTLYLEGTSGISGDMTVAALLDLGGDREGLLRMLKSMPLQGYHVEIGRTEKCGIAACDFDVIMDEHPHEHRHLADIYEIIERTDTEEEVKALAKRMFEIVAEAEAKAHDLPVEKVHFHEVGAVDSIVDIMSAAYLIESLQIDRAVISKLREGTGQVRCQHGILPVPVPAVINILKSSGLPVLLTETEGEMITPTGAAIAAALQEYGEKAPNSTRPQGRLVGTGTGAGKKNFPHANVLRAMLFEESEEASASVPGGKEISGDVLWMLETNIDDCTGETLGCVSELLMEAGARDVTVTPVYMKKNRPAWKLGVLSDEAHRSVLEHLIFLHTTTIGIRRYQVERTVLERQCMTVPTSFGNVQVKKILRPGGVCVMPEYESIREICRRTGGGFSGVYEMIKREVSEGARE